MLEPRVRTSSYMPAAADARAVLDQHRLVRAAGRRLVLAADQAPGCWDSTCCKAWGSMPAANAQKACP